MIPSGLVPVGYDANTTVAKTPDRATLERHGLLDMVALWENWRGGDAVPAWRTVDLLAMPESLRQGTMVADYHAELDDFEVRFWGVGLVTAFQVELTGKWLGHAWDRGVMTSFKRGALEITRDKAPQFLCHHITSAEGVVREFPVVRLPISDDGSTVTKIMTVENI